MDVDIFRFVECWRRSIPIAAWLLLCLSIPSIIVALVYASDCPDKGYKIPFFLFVFGIIGLFTAIMNFYFNSLWSHSNSCRCEGRKESVCFAWWINIGLTFILFVSLFVGLIFGANADSAQCVGVVWRYTVVMCSLGLLLFASLFGVCTYIEGD